MKDTNRDELLMAGLAEWLRDKAVEHEQSDTGKIFKHPANILRNWAREVDAARRAACSSLPDGPVAELEEMRARKDAAYLERNQVVAALAKAFPSGVARTAIEGWSEDWHGCVYIDLPTGQASWHFHDSQAYLFDDLPPYTKEWDGHDTPEKYRRLAALAAPSAQPSGAPEVQEPQK